MRREPRLVFGFFDEILRARPLMVEPRQKRDPTADIRDEYAIAVLAVSNNWYCSGSSAAGACFFLM